MAATNPYLEGNYGPVSEEVTATELRVRGHIPDTLSGRYLRNGPNPVSAPDPARYHWFTGDGMVHGVRLRDGRAEWYRNRWVRAEHVAQALGEERRPGPPPHGDMDAGPNTNVIGHAGRTFALVEAGARPFELTEELDIDRPDRPRRHAERGLHRPPQTRSGQRGALCRVLLLGLGQRRRGDGDRRRRARAIGPAGQPGRLHQPARLRHHRAFRRPLGSARALQHGGRPAGCPVPLSLAGGVPLAGRVAAPGR